MVFKATFNNVSVYIVCLCAFYTEFEKAVLPLLGILQGFRLGDEYKLHVCMRRCCIKIKNRKLHFNTRRLYRVAQCVR